jgi:hypothetical protein
MKKIYLLLITLSAAFATSAQFQISLPGTDATSIIQNPAGNLVVAGYTFTSGTNADILFYEIDTVSGAVIRSKQFATPNLDVPYSICNTPDGNYLATGYVSVTTSDNDLWVAKLDTGLNMIWYKQMGQTGSNSNDYGNNVEVVDSGLYAVSGTTSIGGSAKPSIIYLNDSGNVVNEFYLNTNQFASPKFKARYMGNGTFGFIHLMNDICIVDTSGAILKNEGANYGIYTTDILRNPANANYAFVCFADYGSPQGGSTAFCIYDSSAQNALVNIKYSIASSDFEPNRIIMDNGNFLISGNAMNLSSGASNGVLLKVNATGDLIWAKQFTPAGIQGSAINSVIIAADGNYIVAGNEGVYPNYTMYVAKMDSSGNVCESVDITTTKAQALKTIVTGHAKAFGTNPVLSTTIPSDTVYTVTSTTLCLGSTSIAESPGYSSSVYPNPSNDFLHVETTFKGQTTVCVTSVEGKTVSTQKLIQNGSLDIRTITPGIYILSITDASGNIVVLQKFVKY